MAPKKKSVCIVGGGASGVALMWCLSQDEKFASEWEITLIHNEDKLGGHSSTWPVQRNGIDLQIDIGVQLIAPMSYPNVRLQLEQPEFQKRVSVDEFDELKIACAFPRNPESGAMQNWGNFPSYQKGKQFSLYTSKMLKEAKKFQEGIQWGSLLHISESLEDYFAKNKGTYTKQFIDYFVAPYMSIMNGYGAALLNEVTFEELFPLFAKFPFYEGPQASFSTPGKGWWRFHDGARSWVQAMADIADQKATCHVELNATVDKIFTVRKGNNPVEVQWTDASGPQKARFDKVVMTTDMWTNAKILKNDRNQYFWDKSYKKHIAKKLWGLLPGYCYLHTDEEMLSPDLRNGEEVLQFNAHPFPKKKWPYYNLTKSYTTYLEENLKQDKAAKGLYLTMYGYIPDRKKGDKVPAEDKVLHEKPWRHGMWAPSEMIGPKTSLYQAQAPGVFNYPGQPDTNVYFAGNNTTMDSEEGALLSAMIIANYAWGIHPPLPGFEILHPIETTLAHKIYATFYHDVMFPTKSVKQKLLHVHQTVHQRSES